MKMEVRKFCYGNHFNLPRGAFLQSKATVLKISYDCKNTMIIIATCVLIFIYEREENFYRQK